MTPPSQLKAIEDTLRKAATAAASAEREVEALSQRQLVSAVAKSAPILKDELRSLTSADKDKLVQTLKAKSIRDRQPKQFRSWTIRRLPASLLFGLAGLGISTIAVSTAWHRTATGVVTVIQTYPVVWTLPDGTQFAGAIRPDVPIILVRINGNIATVRHWLNNAGYAFADVPTDLLLSTEINATRSDQ